MAVINKTTRSIAFFFVTPSSVMWGYPYFYRLSHPVNQCSGIGVGGRHFKRKGRTFFMIYKKKLKLKQLMVAWVQIGHSLITMCNFHIDAGLCIAHSCLTKFGCDTNAVKATYVPLHLGDISNNFVTLQKGLMTHHKMLKINTFWWNLWVW